MLERDKNREKGLELFKSEPNQCNVKFLLNALKIIKIVLAGYIDMGGELNLYTTSNGNGIGWYTYLLLRILC